MANFNNVNDTLFTDEANDEPITKEEVKSWLRIDGNDDNNVIENLITTARVLVENYLNQSLIKRTVTAFLNNSCGNVHLPYQPFVELSTIKNANGDEIASGNYSLTGGSFKRLEYPCDNNIEITYTAGVDEVTKPIHTGLLMQIAYMYENRGDSTTQHTLSPMAKSVLKSSRK